MPKIIFTSVGNGQCYMEDGQVNPLGFVPRPGMDEIPLENLMEPPEENTTDSGEIRVRRDTEMIIRSEVRTDKDGRRKHVVTMVSFCFKLFSSYFIFFL